MSSPESSLHSFQERAVAEATARITANLANYDVYQGDGSCSDCLEIIEVFTIPLCALVSR